MLNKTIVHFFMKWSLSRTLEPTNFPIFIPHIMIGLFTFVGIAATSLDSLRLLVPASRRHGVPANHRQNLPQRWGRSNFSLSRLAFVILIEET